MDLADLLRSRDETTVRSLAGELGVSRRTLLRDLAALRARGMPIRGEAGPGGGIRFEGNRGLTAVHVSVREVVALWLAARLSREASDLPWNRAAQTGLAKLLGSLPDVRARELRALCRRVVIGPPASPSVRATAGSAPAEFLALFERAFSGGLGLRFRYEDGQGRRSVRRVEPHGLLVETPVWYLLSRDVEKGEPRMFRMDRISRPGVLNDWVFRPAFGVIRAQLPDLVKWKPLLAR